MSDNRFWFIFLLQFQIQPLASQWNKLNKTWIVKYFLIVYDSQDILLTTMVTYCKIHLQPTIITIFICMKYSEMNSINIHVHVFLVCFFHFLTFNLSTSAVKSRLGLTLNSLTSYLVERKAPMHWFLEEFK